MQLVIEALAKFDFSSVTNSRRIFHGRGGCFSELDWCCIDYFAPVIFVTLFAKPPQEFISRLQNFYQNDAIRGRIAILLQHRYLPQVQLELVAGELPQQCFARRKDLRFTLDFAQKNCGYFLDMEPGRKWLEEHAKGKKVLNLFSYTCAFSVVASFAGADSVVNVDMSKNALSRGRENHRVNDISTKNIQFLPLNILKSWSRIRKNGPYDIVIIDPPSYQKGSFIAERDYRKIISRLPEFINKRAKVLACLNAPELNYDFLTEQFSNLDDRSVISDVLQPSSDFPNRQPERGLKLMTVSF